MNEILPLAPQVGMSTFWYLSTVLVIGLVFGFALERAGFGSAKTLTNIFILRDFRVFRVMFTGVLTAMLGIHLLHYLGMVNLSLIGFVPDYLLAMVVGGVIFGVGFYVGGFCPGTAIVAVARGRWDGLAFLGGITLGIMVFAELFDLLKNNQAFMTFYEPADAKATTLYGSGSAWPWIVGIAAAAFMGFLVTPIIEKRFGLWTVKELENGKKVIADESGGQSTSAPPYWRWGGPIAAAVVILVIVFAETSQPYPELASERPRYAHIQESEKYEKFVSAQTLAGWIIESAHRTEDGEDNPLIVLDFRGRKVRDRVPIPTAHSIDIEDLEGWSLVGKIIRELMNAGVERGTTVVAVGVKDDKTIDLISYLRRRHIRTHLMEACVETDGDGCTALWERDVLGWNFDASSFPVAAHESVASLWGDVRAWLSGETEELPGRFVFPGAIPPEAEVSTIVATGSGAGGGCR